MGIGHVDDEFAGIKRDRFRALLLNQFFDIPVGINLPAERAERFQLHGAQGPLGVALIFDRPEHHLVYGVSGGLTGKDILEKLSRSSTERVGQNVIEKFRDFLHRPGIVSIRNVETP